MGLFRLALPGVQNLHNREGTTLFVYGIFAKQFKSSSTHTMNFGRWVQGFCHWWGYPITNQQSVGISWWITTEISRIETCNPAQPQNPFLLMLKPCCSVCSFHSGNLIKSGEETFLGCIRTSVNWNLWAPIYGFVNSPTTLRTGCHAELVQKRLKSRFFLWQTPRFFYPMPWLPVIFAHCLLIIPSGKLT